ncbi:MAG TPA: dihydrofolate reductase family protein [Puia sp.]|jgi:dihydrofolate reductase
MSQRKVILSMQMTLDGYVADHNDEADWLQTGDEEWQDLSKDLEAADTYLLGRKMYPLYSSYWQSVLKDPDSDENELSFAKLADKTQHIVFTKGDFKPDWKNTKVAHDLKGEIENLKKQPGKNIIAWGGANFASSLINLGLVEELRIALNPTILGDGKAMFGNANRRSQLQLLDSRPLTSGLVVLRYKVGA